MKHLLILAIIVFTQLNKTAAQQNWAAVPCFELKTGDYIGRMFVDDAHNEIILNSAWSYKICNSTYKGFFAYNGSTFHDLDIGIETHDNLNPAPGTIRMNNCTEYNGKAIFYGLFNSVGSNTLYTKYIAVWDGAAWDTMPHRLIASVSNPTAPVGFVTVLKHEGKLWMFGAYDSSGTFKQRPVIYDGSSYTSLPKIPVNVPSAITEAIIYKNKLVVAGNFYDYPSYDFNRLAEFDGTGWSQMGTGVRGNLSGVGNLAIYKDTLYVAGSFPKSAGNAGNYLMKWDGTQLTDAGFSNVHCGYGAIYRLLPYRNRLYAFGTFGCAANKKAFGVAYYENGIWTVPPDSFDAYINDAVVYKDAIYIGGAFQSINGDSTIQKFAKLMCPDFDAASGCLSGLKESINKLEIKIFPNPSQDKLHIEFEQNIAIDKISISNTLGQELYKQVKPQSKQEVDISNLPAGIYFLKAENKTASTVCKVVKE